MISDNQLEPRPLNIHYTGLETDTATKRTITVLYVSECFIVNILLVQFVLTY